MRERKKSLGSAALEVLAAIARGCPYGFDIMDETELKSGTVYRALGRLEELGLVRSRWEEPELAVEGKRPRRRYYAITESGQSELAAARKRLAELSERLAPESR